jgi:hypothetical protein
VNSGKMLSMCFLMIAREKGCISPETGMKKKIERTRLHGTVARPLS